MNSVELENAKTQIQGGVLDAETLVSLLNKYKTNTSLYKHLDLPEQHISYLRKMWHITTFYGKTQATIKSDYIDNILSVLNYRGKISDILPLFDNSRSKVETFFKHHNINLHFARDREKIPFVENEKFFLSEDPEDCMCIDNILYYRVVAKKTFFNSSANRLVPALSKGGYVQYANNLNDKTTSWVFDHAMITGDGRLNGNKALEGVMHLIDKTID